MLFAPKNKKYSEKNPGCSQAHVVAPFAMIFDLLARNSVSKTVLGDCSLVCDSSIAPISFCFCGLYFAYFAILGAVENELAC
jgi:hypothetical protein